MRWMTEAMTSFVGEDEPSCSGFYFLYDVMFGSEKVRKSDAINIRSEFSLLRVCIRHPHQHHDDDDDNDEKAVC